jgi:hypothetical protein
MRRTHSGLPSRVDPGISGLLQEDRQAWRIHMVLDEIRRHTPALQRKQQL